MKEYSKKSGFTLLELLIVIAIIAILSVVVVLFINPVEMLKKGRDVQRISDLATMKTAITLFLQDKSTNTLELSGAVCKPSGTLILGTDPVYASQFGTNLTAPGTSTTTNDSSGWIKINFTDVTSGAPVSNLPIDPVNDTTYYYRYGCLDNWTFELDTALESTAFTSTDDRRVKDGGNNTTRYEVGTALTILP